MTQRIPHARHAAIIAVGALLLASPACAQPPSNSTTLFYSPALEAPFGDRVGETILNYNRVSPYIATAGLLQAGGVAEAKKLGFQTIIDLRRPDEPDQSAEAGLAAAAHIRYLSIPIAEAAPTEEQLALFAATLSETDNQPVLVHCASANRAGAMWALYRASAGVPPAIAIEEGRAAGLKSREAQVREILGLSPL